MQHFRTRYQNKGFSQKSIDLLALGVDKNSSKSISSNIRNWCDSHWVDPTSCNLNSICEFFANMIVAGKSYYTITGYRTSISEIHNQVDGFTVGTHLIY